MYIKNSTFHTYPKHMNTLNSCKVPHGLKNFNSILSQALRLLQESQFVSIKYT